MKPTYSTLGDAIYSKIDDNEYLNEIYNTILFNYSMQLLGTTHRNRPINREHALRFADILSKSYGHPNSEKHKAWAQEIIALLNALYPTDAKVKAYASSILQNIGNYRGLQLIRTKYKSSSFLDELYSNFDLDYLEIPHQENKYFFHPQKEIYNHLNDKVFSYSGPTSLGKSLIMRMFIKDKVLSGYKGNFAILVPTTALISEISTNIIKEDLKDELEKQNYRVITSGNSPHLKDENKNFIMVMTPERLLYTLISFPTLSVDFLFIDEAHRISMFDGRATFYFKVTDMLLQRERQPHLILASPNIPNPGTFLKILPNYEQLEPTILKTTFTPVSQMKYVLDLKEHKMLVFNPHKKGKNVFEEIQALSPNITINDLVRSIIQKDLTKSTLIYCSGKNKAVTMAIDYAKDSSVAYLNEKELDDLADEIRNDIHSDYYLADLIRKGVAYHVGYLPLHVRTKIEELYRVKKIKAIFCTSTIIEGVNLPADNLIAVSCNIGNAGTMSAVEFKNMLGRVGRIEYNLYGNVFIIRQEKHTSMDTIKELLIKDVPDQKVALTESLSLCNKMTIVENLAKGNTQIPHPDNVKDEEYNLMRKTSLILLRDIMKDRQSVVREQFNSVLNEESIAKIKSHFTDTTAKKAEPDDDINVSPDQTERLVYAINEEGLKYPDLVNGNVEYNDLRDFLWKLNDVFKWSIYEKKTLGNGNKINYYAVILTRWMNSYGLKQLLQDTLNHNLQHGEMVQLPDRSVVPYNNSQQHKNIVIGDTLQIIENVILFSIANYFLRFSNEYKRLKTNGQPFKNDWYEYVEYGSTNELTIFLQRNGFERDTADYIKKHQDQYVIKVNGEYKLKPSILECDKRSVVDDIKDIAYNIPELFFRQ